MFRSSDSLSQSLFQTQISPLSLKIIITKFSGFKSKILQVLFFKYSEIIL